MFAQAKKRISTSRPTRPTRPSQTHSCLGLSQYALFAIGMFALSYAGFALLDARLFQAYQTWRFERAARSMEMPIGRAEHLRPQILPADSEEANHTRLESPGIAGGASSPLGRIEISSIGLAAMILEGTDDRTLRRAVGHIPGTPLPGRSGNVAIAGHRDTFFRPLRNIRKDDEITLATLNGYYRYRVDSTRVVEPEDSQVLEASADAILTLVTCYPFNFLWLCAQAICCSRTQGRP